MVQNFTQLVNEVQSRVKQVIAVAVAHDLDVLEAIERAEKAGISSAILVGNKERIEEIIRKNKIDLNEAEIVNQPDELAAVNFSIDLIRGGKANVLMKGLCSTSIIMKAVLNKDRGLRESKILSHFALFEIPTYHKLILMSDAALNISPTLEEKVGITENAIYAANRLDIIKPKVAIISAIEKVNAGKMPATTDAAIISKMADRGQIPNALIDGPLAVDNAFSKKSCQIKNLDSPVGGDTDIAIMPNIECGNIFYKLLTYLAKSKTAGIIIGAKVPIILTSRADSDESKFLSIAAAARVSSGGK
jgi:phosphate butyryltransferase